MQCTPSPTSSLSTPCGLRIVAREGLQLLMDSAGSPPDPETAGNPKTGASSWDGSTPAVSDAPATTGRDFGIRLQRLGEELRLAVSLHPQAPAAYSKWSDPKSHRGEKNKGAEPPADFPQSPAQYHLRPWQERPLHMWSVHPKDHRVYDSIYIKYPD